MDKDDVFGLFEGDTSTPLPNPPKQKNKEVNKLQPLYIRIGMFTKIIVSSTSFQNEVEKFLKEEEALNPILDRSSSHYKVFARAWAYIKDIDINQIDHLRALRLFNKKVLLGSLKYAIWYFEAQEEYLKCAHLQKIQFVVKERKK